MCLSKTSLCWICNKEPATTGEHRSKRSDIKDQLGENAPLYFHTDARRNRKLQSDNAKALKFAPSLCNKCNSAKTQKHDLAWQQLSRTLRNRNPPLRTGDIIQANSVFTCAPSAEMLHVHLFFVKWLGCEIVESCIPTDPSIETFSHAIMNDEPHLGVWLAFGFVQRSEDWVGASNVNFASFKSEASYDYLCRFYEVGSLNVRVRLSSIKLKDDWHPAFTDRFVITDLLGS